MTLPVLWLCGPAGVGKTTVAWQLFTGLARDGTPTGYVDLDQLGMCYAAPTPDNWAPEPASDPGRHRTEAGNLGALAVNFQAAGARGLVVSGVVDPARGPEVDLVPQAALTVVRLRAEPAEMRQRVLRRGRPNDPVEVILREAAAMDALPGVSVDTTGHDVAGVVRLVRERVGTWPGRAGPAAPPAGPVSTSGRILWVCGATAVGKSTVGWQVYRQVRQAGYRAAFVDLDQIGFHRPVPAGDPGNHRLKAANLAAVWRTFRARRAECLVAVGPVGRDDVGLYTAALPGATVTLCRLHASPGQLAERVMLRGRGGGETWGLPGDELVGQPAALLRRLADQAAADAAALDRAGVGELRVDADGRPPADLAAEILARTGWLDRLRTGHDDTERDRQ